MDTEDLQYLKRATPAKLMVLSNGIPWQLCAWIKVALTQSKQEALDAEWAKWSAAGAVDIAALTPWLKTRSNDLNPCDECGLTRYKSNRRITFSRDRGFGLHYLCSPCALDFDHRYDILKCLAPKVVAQ